MYTEINIPDGLNIKYISELKRDSDKDFGEEFIRTTDLEARLVRDYGINGLKLILSCKKMGEIYPLGNIPDGSPWSHLNGKFHDEAIDTIFSPIIKKLPKLLTMMKDRVRFIYVEHKNSIWTLNYFLDMKLYDDREYFIIFSGGEPENTPSLNKNLVKYNWEIPTDLKEFYSVHNGFGSEEDSMFILGCTQISVMGEMMNPIAKEQNMEPEGYVFNDLLEFYPDGAGNAQCFLRKKSNNNTTVDWDHEVWEISEETNFYEFIDDSMSELDEE